MTTTWANPTLYMADFWKAFDKGWSDAVKGLADPPADPAMSAAYDAGFMATAGTTDKLMRSEYRTAAQAMAMRGFGLGLDPSADSQVPAILAGFPDRSSAQVQNLLSVYRSAASSGKASQTQADQPKSSLVKNLVAGSIFVAGIGSFGALLAKVIGSIRRG